MSKKNFFIAAVQVIIIGVFILIAAGSGGSSNLSSQDAYNAGYEIGHGVGTLINNYFFGG